MNRAIQSGIGLAFTAGAVFFPSSAEAQEPGAYAVVDSCDKVPESQKPGTRLGKVVCDLYSEENPETTVSNSSEIPTTSNISPEFEDSETDPFLSNYLKALAVLSIGGAVVGIGGLKAYNHLSDQKVLGPLDLIRVYRFKRVLDKADPAYRDLELIKPPKVLEQSKDDF